MKISKIFNVHWAASEQMRILALPATVAMLAFLLMLPVVAADVTLVSPDEGVLASQAATFSFSVSDAAQNCTLAIDGVANKTVQITQNQQAFASAYLNEGQYSWNVYCAVNASQVTSPARQLAIDLTPPDVKLVTPQTTFNTSTVALTYYSQDTYLKNCTLLARINGLMTDAKANLTPNSGKNNTFTIQLQDGQYDWNVRCTDRAGHANTPFFTSSFGIDTTPPAVSNIQPSAIVTAATTTLSLATSEDAECRYSTSSQGYSSMARFSITGGKQHQQPLAFQADGQYLHYVVCQDMLGNSMAPKRIDINVHMLPSAKVTLSKPSPVKAGIIGVTLATSKNMGFVPYLSYNLAGKDVVIALSGQNSQWTGNILVEDSQGTKIATFMFKGTDTEGYTGTAITDGSSFIVDTAKPVPPQNLMAEETNRSITLRWYSASSDALQYRVYRLASPSVSYMDVYLTVNSTFLIDQQVQDKVTYYYRVAALDDAGNLGDLSETVYATAHSASEANSSITQETKPESPSLPPGLVVEVNDAAKKVEEIKLSTEAAASTMAALSGQAKEAASLTGIKGQADGASARLGQLLLQLDSLKGSYREEGELRALLAKVTNEASRIELETVKDVRITGHIEDLPVTRKEQVLKALDKTFSAAEMPKNKEEYVSKNEKELLDLQLKTEADVASFVMINGTSNEKTFIRHTFTYTGIQPTQDSLAIIFVPKVVASSSRELSYPEGKPEVLQDDPVLKWGFLSIGPSGQTVSYIVGKKLSAEEVRGIEVVPLLNVNKMTEAVKSPTGLAVMENIPKAGSFWIIVPGLLVVLALGGYYLVTTPRNANNEDKVSDPVPDYALTQLNDRLSTIQAEIDEEIYPLLSSIRNAVIRKDDMSSEKLISSLIGTAKGYIRELQADKAKAVYPAIQLLYQLLSQEQKARYSAECIWLHKQIKAKGKRGI